MLVNIIKKYVANDAKVIKEELEKANKTIEELTFENNELKAELENLKTHPIDADKEENAEKDEEETTGEDTELKTNKK